MSPIDRIVTVINRITITRHLPSSPSPFTLLVFVVAVVPEVTTTAQ